MCVSVCAFNYIYCKKMGWMGGWIDGWIFSIKLFPQSCSAIIMSLSHFQIARAAAVFSVDEIVVFDEQR